MNIAVIGAGPAGLRTAQLLEQQGHNVTVFEARDRVGGRLHTVEVTGGAFDAGAEWIDADHNRVKALCEELGLNLAESDQWPGRVIYNGDERAEDDLWPEAEADVKSVHKAAEELCRELPDPVWGDPSVSELDLQTLDEFLDEYTSSKIGRWWCEAMHRSDEGEDTEQIGLLGWLVGYRSYLRRGAGDMSAYRIEGGSQQLCSAMAKSLKTPVVVNRPLRSVQAREDVVELWFDGEMAFVDRVVLTVPPACLLNIDFFDTIPTEKTLAWEMIGASRAIKVCMEFEEPFWREDGWAGRALSDLPFQQIWDGGHGGAAVLNAYICGDQAVNVAERSDPVDYVVRAVSQLDPRFQAQFIQGWLYDWPNDEWAQGAFAYLPPGSVMTALPRLGESAGRVHFAGEHTANWLGFIEGALESAERVSKEIGDAD